ncbi:RAD protein [Plasmodium cynomolgi strain B]|uniref:RAD protein n=1 Tax=Plasmodium cynomolgi (strain B) TaxID=1120755 RepID=K6UI54_PLACD|nr:RAD protein [Plasmodium cynomolgi strain B]GAB64693.1 RAD protein [Plasmodium cynomolgi strain B]
MNLKEFFLLSFFLFALVLASFNFSQIKSIPINDGTIGLQLDNSSYGRLLAQASHSSRPSISKTNTNISESSSVNIHERVQNLPFHCDASKLSKQLTEEEIKGLLKSYGKSITQENAHIVFNYVHNLQRKNYIDLIEGLWKHFMELSQKYGIPDDYRYSCWWKCNNELLNELMDIDHFDHMDLFTYIKGKNNNNATFTKFIEDKMKLSNEIIEKNREKWTKLLTERIKNKSYKK